MVITNSSSLPILLSGTCPSTMAMSLAPFPFLSHQRQVEAEAWHEFFLKYRDSLKYRFFQLGLVSPPVLRPMIPARLKRRLTFGLELEMVIKGYRGTAGHGALLSVIRHLYRTGVLRNDAQYSTAGTNRNKFLIVADESINPRIRLREGVNMPILEDDEALEEVLDMAPSKWDMDYCDDDDDGFGTGGKKITIKRVGKTKQEKINDYWASLADRCFEIGSPVEICTPILGYATHEHTITVMLSRAAQELDLQFNHTCGLHVHVGCGKGSSWSLEELKAIGKATVLWEVIVDLIHAPHRVKGNWMIASNRRNPQLRGLNVAAAFRKIDRAADLETFYRIIGPAKFYKYNFIANTDYGTIEFRQAEGHKDPVRAIDWIRIITQMVSTALGATRMEWARWAVIAGMGEAPEDLLGLEKEEWERWGMPEHLRLRAMSM